MVVVAINPASFASLVTYTGTFSPSLEVPAVTNSGGTGSILLTYNNVAHTLAANVAFTGLSANVSAATLQVAGAGSNGPVAIFLIGFPAATSGTYTNTFDLTAASTYTPNFVNLSGGSATSAEALLIGSLDGSSLYANLHNSVHPSGEIRANLSPVPEPASVLVFATGALTLIRRTRQKQH